VSSSDRLLVPACTCGKELTLATPNPLPNRDATHVRVYRCGNCGHEMRITVWGTDVCDAYTPLRARAESPSPTNPASRLPF
jgi:DNA-directed RNA polymerase subunit RPC12/RpoP